MFRLFSLRSSDYQLGCTVAAVSAQRPVEHVKNTLQNITTEGAPHSVYLGVYKRVLKAGGWMDPKCGCCSLPGHRPGHKVRLEVPVAPPAHGVQQRRPRVVVHEVDVAGAVILPFGSLLVLVSHFARDRQFRVLRQKFDF